MIFNLTRYYNGSIAERARASRSARATLGSIADDFRDQINLAAQDPTKPFATGLRADTSTGSLVIADLAGRTLGASVVLKPVAVADIDGGRATTTLVNLIGTPLANETWRLRVGDLVYSLDTGATPPTLAQIAASLAAQLNADNASAARYTALVDGTQILVVDREGGVFETRLDAGNISRFEGHDDIQLDYKLDEAGMEQALERLYGFQPNEDQG